MKQSKLGKVNADFDIFILKNVFTKNDAGEWGGEPDENAIGVIRSTNFNNNGILDLSDVAYRTLKPSKKKEKLLEINDILIERSGGSDTQPVGRVGLITKEILKEEFVFANFIQRIAVDESINSTYLYYCLQQMYEMGITTGMQNQTTGIRNLDWKLYSRTVLPKPSKSEQTAIASVLSKIDKAIENVQNSIKAAEKLKKALMQNLLTGKMKPDGSFRTEEEFYIDEKYARIPIGWSIKTIKDLSTQVTDGEHSTPIRTESGFYLLSARNIKNGYLDLSDVDYVGEQELKRIQKRCNPQEGDILISCSGTIGNVCIAPKGLNAGMVRSAALVKLKKEDTESKFIELMLQSFDLQRQMKVSVASSVQGNIFQGAIKKLKVLHPESKDERSAIVNKIYNISGIISQKQTKIKTLERLKKSLMQNLLTGKKRLSQEIINKLTQK